jgi:hypothetical protein
VDVTETTKADVAEISSAVAIVAIVAIVANAEGTDVVAMAETVALAVDAVPSASK